MKYLLKSHLHNYMRFMYVEKTKVQVPFLKMIYCGICQYLFLKQKNCKNILKSR